MNVKVYADIACPWCRLRAHQFRREVAAAHAGRRVELVHLPYQLDAQAPEEPKPLMEEMAGMFGEDRASTMASEMTRLGAAEGVEYRFDRALAANTLAAHRLLWLTLREHGAGAQASLATALYDAQWRDGGNVADHAELAGLAEGVGLDGGRARRFLGSDEGVGEVREQAAAARRDGVASVPTFVSRNGGLRGHEEILDDLARAFENTERSQPWTG